MGENDPEAGLGVSDGVKGTDCEAVGENGCDGEAGIAGTAGTAGVACSEFIEATLWY